jgi:hypothetical protein
MKNLEANNRQIVHKLGDLEEALVMDCNVQALPIILPQHISDASEEVYD